MSVAITASQYIVGNASARFQNGDCFRVASPITIGSNDFTIEFYALFSSFGSNSGMSIISNDSFSLVYDKPNSQFKISYRSGSFQTFTMPCVLNTGAWTHIALCRQAGVIRLMVNGIAVGSDVQVQATIAASTYCAVGLMNSTADGYMCDIRITVGSSRYWANFTPSLQPFGASLGEDALYGQVQFLMRMDTIPSLGGNLTIGALHGAEAFKGSLDDLRYLTGKSLYSGNFTPYCLLNYNVIGGALPSGLVLGSDGTLTGSLREQPGSIEPETNPPVWAMGGSLANLNEDMTFSTSLAAAPATGRSISRYTLVNGALPWGLTVNPSTGLLSGTAIDTLPGIISPPRDDVSAKPTWDQSVAATRTAYEGFPISFATKAIPTSSRTISSYFVKGGNIPLGLELDTSSGFVSGILDDLITSPSIAEIAEKPLWVTPSGSLMILEEGDIINSTIQASSFYPSDASKDPQWDFVISQLHMDGTTGATAFVDETGKPVVANGSASLSNMQAMFGSTAALLTGGTDSIDIQMSNLTMIGNSDFTLEFFLYTFNSTNNWVAFSQGGPAGLEIRNNEVSNGISVYIAGTLYQTGIVLSNMQWYYIVVQRSGGQVKIAINGAITNTVTNSSSIPNSTLRIGRYTSTISTASFVGLIDEFRLSKCARYLGTIQTPTQAFPSGGNTVVSNYSVITGSLPTGMSINTSTGAISGAAKPLATRTSSTVDVITPAPIWGYSGLTDLGTYDQNATLSLPLSVSLQGGASSKSTFVKTGGLPWGIKLDRTSGLLSGTLASGFGGADIRSNPGTPPLWNTGANLGSIYEGDSASTKLNATALYGTAISNYFITGGGFPFGLALDPTTGDITGTADDLIDGSTTVDRGEKPTWTTASGLIGAFEQDQSASIQLVAIPTVDDLFLSNFETGLTSDNLNTLTPTDGSIGGALPNIHFVSGAKVGLYALAITPTRYFTVPQNNNYEFSGDFTFESWIKLNAIATDNPFFTKWTDDLQIGSGVNSYRIGYSSSGLYMKVENSSGNIDTYSAMASLNVATWYHVAIIRNSGYVIFYLNGIELGRSSYSAPVLVSSASFSIGGFGTTSSDALFDNMRVSNIANYKTNFVPPIAVLSGRNAMRGYEVKSGNLPTGMILNPTSGSISGAATFTSIARTGTYDAIPTIPVWNYTVVSPATSADLGTWEDKKAVNINLDLTLRGGASSTNFALRTGSLPWGLKLDRSTGVISGTTDNFLHSNDTRWNPTPAPSWVTPQAIGSLYENTSSSFTIQATPNLGTAMTSYSIINGVIPWGLALDRSSGSITGIADDLIDPTLPAVERAEKPTWNNGGDLGTYEEGEVLNLPLSIAANPSALSYIFFTPTGSLPFGVMIDGASIKGTIGQLNVRSSAVAEFTSNSPTWATDNASPFLVEDSLTASIALSATPTASRTIASYTLLNGSVPFGMTLDKTSGSLAGTIELINRGATTQNFDLPAPTWDINGSYTYTINEGGVLSFALPATPNLGSALRFYIRDGFLPWGFKISGNVLSGTGVTDVIAASENRADVTPKPTWNIPDGNIWILEDQASSNITMDVVPDAGASLASFAVVNGTIPFGLLMDQSSGAITGNIELPSRGDTSTVQPGEIPVWASNGTYTQNVNESDTLNWTFSATPQFGTTVRYFILSGALPWGANLDAVNAKIIGTVIPDAFSTNTAPRDDITPKPTIYGSNLGNIGLSTTSSVVLSATAGSGSITKFSIINGALPWGLVLDSSGAITGKVDAQAVKSSYSFTVRVIDSSFAYQDADYTITVVDSYPDWQNPANLGTINGGVAYNLTLSAPDPSSGTVSFSLQSGTLPSGLTMSGNTISGTPVNAISLAGSTFTIRASSTSGSMADRTFTLVIAANSAPVWTTGTALTSQTVNSPHTITLAASDPNNDTITYSYQSGNIPDGMSFTNGVLSGTPITIQNVSFTIRAQDSLGGYTDRTFTLSIV